MSKIHEKTFKSQDEIYNNIKRNIADIWDSINKKRFSFVDYSRTEFLLKRSFRRMNHIELMKIHEDDASEIKREIEKIENTLSYEARRLNENRRKLEVNGFKEMIRCYITIMTPALLIACGFFIFYCIVGFAPIDYLTMIGAIVSFGFVVFIPIYIKYFIASKYNIADEWRFMSSIFHSVKFLLNEKKYERMKKYFPKGWVAKYY